jgi:wobble nucleotide-excising tRNase
MVDAWLFVFVEICNRIQNVRNRKKVSKACVESRLVNEQRDDVFCVHDW